MTVSRFSRLGAVALGALFGLLFASGWEFLAFYERLPLPWAQAAWAALLALAGMGARYMPRPSWVLAAALVLVVPANFVLIGSAAPPAGLVHALVGGATLAVLARFSRAGDCSSATLRWQLVGAAGSAQLHPPLALALGGANGWWMAAIVFAMPAAIAIGRGAGHESEAKGTASVRLPDVAVLASLALLVFALPVYFDLVLGSPGGAQLGTVALASGLLLGTAAVNHRWAGRQASLGLAFAALAVMPWGATGWTWTALFVGGVGTAPAAIRAAQGKPGRTALALACGAAAATVMCGAILSVPAAGSGARWALAATCGVLPALAFAWCARTRPDPG